MLEAWRWWFESHHEYFDRQQDAQEMVVRILNTPCSSFAMLGKLTRMGSKVTLRHRTHFDRRSCCPTTESSHETTAVIMYLQFRINEQKLILTSAPSAERIS